MQPNSLWQAVLGEIELSVSRGNFVTWFGSTQLIDHSEECATIAVKNVFIKQTLEKRYTDLIRQTLAKNGVSPQTIEYKIAPAGERKASAPTKTSKAAPSSSNQPSLALARRTGNSLTHNYRPGLNEAYIFDTFIVGSANELAHAACQAVAQNIGRKYNPLFLYGGVGIGKTHLIQAVGNAVIGNKPDARIVYATTEQFVQEFVDALRFKKTTDFAKHYRSADVLIVDDMQFIAGKEKVQEEFFHTFNTLHQAHKQIIISSDRPPNEIPTLEDRLKSRFSAGMTIDMQHPDFEMRCAIVQSKAQAHDMELPPEVVEFLSNLVQTNIRELEGNLNRLLAYCEMRSIQPDMNIAVGLFGSGKSRPKHLSPRHIMERTARHFEITLEELLGPKRDRDIVVPRQVAMYMMRSELHLSFPRIASELGRKDHTTAMHSVLKIEKDSHLDTDLREAIENIREKLYA
jgi:chromosomal replication initiator protein